VPLPVHAAVNPHASPLNRPHLAVLAELRVAATFEGNIARAGRLPHRTISAHAAAIARLSAAASVAARAGTVAALRAGSAAVVTHAAAIARLSTRSATIATLRASSAAVPHLISAGSTIARLTIAARTTVPHLVATGSSITRLTVATGPAISHLISARPAIARLAIAAGSTIAHLVSAATRPAIASAGPALMLRWRLLMLCGSVCSRCGMRSSSATATASWLTAGHGNTCYREKEHG
jgi:hypothetical protein